jgi:hypothetical protein
MADTVARLRNYLIAQGAVRDPGVAPGARPGLPPAWKHPDNGAINPGDAQDAGKDQATWDDGLVVSLMWAPGFPPETGGEERRRDVIDVNYRGNAVPAIVALDGAIRHALLGNPPFPGGKTDWVMDGLYVIQAQQTKPFAPVWSENGIYAFTVGYLFEIRQD